MTKHYFIYRNDDLLIQDKQPAFTLPTADSALCQSFTDESTYLFYTEEEAQYFIAEVEDTYKAPQGYVFTTLREAKHHHGQHLYSMALQSYQLHNWRRQHQYCGVCGTKFNAMKEDRSLSCPKCQNLLFPQTSTAVIIAIIKEGKILLAHNANFPEGLYSIIAGFVEMGESFDNAIHREIYEEVGLKVKNVRYFDSQPWPFPNSTMIGFFADYDSGEIQVDGTEILDAHWYTPENLPMIPSGYSIARRLIEAYRSGDY